MKNKKSKSIEVYDKQNNSFLCFNSIRECAKHFKVSFPVILYVLNHSKIYKKQFVINYKTMAV